MNCPENRGNGIGADSLGYLSLEWKCWKRPIRWLPLLLGLFDGKYPIVIPEKF
jgi:glutamine phosphoribosylpyrophosphate amidotransferase